MRASEMSVVLQLPVHKLTWLKIVQNIQSMREGVAAFLKKEELSSICWKSPPNLVHCQQEAPRGGEAGGPQHPLQSELGGRGGAWQ